jgi:Holliday junction DNA helicase RuvA
MMPSRDLAGLRGTATVHTVMLMRDGEEPQLYGFTNERGRELFRALTSVSTVGPKSALAVLSLHAPDSLERAIVAGDNAALTMVSGVGTKMAQRIILELRDKLGLAPEQVAVGPLAEVREALLALGYTAAEVTEVLRELPSDGDAPTLLRFALRSLGSRESA